MSDTQTVTGHYVKDIDHEYGYIYANEKKYVLTKKPSIKILIDDYVLFNTYTEKIELLERTHNYVAGVLNLTSSTIFGFNNKGKPKKLFNSYDRHIGNFIVPVDNKYKQYRSDIYVIIAYNSWQDNDTYPTGSIEKIIGPIGDIKSERLYLECICTSNWCTDKKLLSYDTNTSGNEKKYEDYTKECIFSVDPVGCKDIDDAIHIKEINDDIYEIGIHIADVSSNVENNLFHAELQKRMQSLYLATGQKNMLPNELSEKEYSLIENMERKCFSVILKIKTNLNNITDDTISIVDCKFIKTKIINKKNFTYDEAQNIVNCEDSIREATALSTSLVKSYALGKKLYENKYGRVFVYDTHKMIEILMICANVQAAKYMLDNSNYCLLRKHELNNKINIQKLELNVDQEILDKIQVYSMKAVYCLNTTEKYRHDGLNVEYYTHFTSPIRRYADLLVHKIISADIKPDATMLEKIIYNLNRINKLHSKIELRSNILETIYTLYQKQNQDVELVTIGVIIGICQNQVILYVDEYKLNITITVIPNKLLNLFDIQYVKIENINKSILIKKKISDDEITYNLADDIKISVVISFLSVKKIHARIIELDNFLVY